MLAPGGRRQALLAFAPSHTQTATEAIAVPMKDGFRSTAAGCGHRARWMHSPELGRCCGASRLDLPRRAGGTTRRHACEACRAAVQPTPRNRSHPQSAVPPAASPAPPPPRRACAGPPGSSRPLRPQYPSLARGHALDASHVFVQQRSALARRGVRAGFGYRDRTKVGMLTSRRRQSASENPIATQDWR